MRRHRLWSRSVLLLGLSFVTACAGTKATPVVQIAGDVSVQVGQTLKLTATTVNGTDSGYTWSSADTAIATVDATGKVTGVAAGETKISVTGKDTAAAASHGVAVLTEPPTATVAAAVTTYMLAIGGTTQATATTTNGTDSGYTWASSDDQVASVDATGLVTAVGPGEAVVTATGADTGAKGDVGVVILEPGIDPTKIPNYDAWAGSGHALATAEPFTHWNADDPPEVPTSCARCHTTSGYRDYLGDDGSAVGTVDHAVPVGEVITCNACHSAAAQKLTSVTFPSGATVSNLDSSARCMVCHQGRESTVSVNTAVPTTAAPDTIDTSLGFINVHYFAAGATLNGGLVQGGYQYDGQSYDVRFAHVSTRDSCVGCHDQHTLKIRLDACETCHTGVTTVDDLKNIRMASSAAIDYDGNGDTTEGIWHEVDHLRTQLLTAIQAYATGLTGADAICYDPATYPYFFKDTDGNGACDATEAVFANGYKTWTPRLVRATYNLQYVTKDPGAFAHNAKYVIELMYDSMNDLNPANVTGLTRTDFGHFQGSAEQFRHWDADGAVSASCSRCHGGATGFHFFLEYGTGTEVPIAQANGLQCETCHDNLQTFTRIQVPTVTLPSGVTTSLQDNDSNMCATCHQGRESKASVDAKIASGTLGFVNIHYLPAAATLLGDDGKVGYEYDGKSYAATWTHPPGTSCTLCHDPVKTKHTFRPQDNVATCQICHTSITNVQDIVMRHNANYDNDPATTTLHDQLEGLRQKLVAAMSTVSIAGGNPICYDPAAYPYFFNDTDSSGSCDATEAVFANAYSAWTPALLKASFNLQFATKDPGAFAHNFAYMGELLYDSIEDIGGDTTGLIRPQTSLP